MVRLESLVVPLAAMLAGCSTTIDSTSSSSGMGSGGGSSTGSVGTDGGSGGGLLGSAWPHAIDATTSASLDALVVDSGGNVTVAGKFEGMLSYPAKVECPGGTCGYVAKFDASGALLWEHTWLGMGGIETVALAVGPGDEIIATGDFAGSFDFGAGPVGAGPRDVYLVAYDPDGARRWSWHFSGPGDMALNQAAGIAVQANGDVVVGGYSDGYLDFGIGLLARGTYVAAFDSHGVVKWNKSFPGSGPFPQDGSPHWTLAVDSAGNIIYTPTWDSAHPGTPLDFGCGAAVTSNQSPVYVVKFDAQGHCLFTKVLQDFFIFPDASVAPAPDGSIWVAGPGGNAQEKQVVLLKLDGIGNVISNTLFAGTSGGAGLGVNSVNGNLALTGGTFSSGAIDLGSGMLPPPGDIIAGEFTAEGSPLWSGRYGDGQPAAGGVIGFTSGGVAFGGNYTGTLILDDTPMQAEGMGSGFVGYAKLPQ